MMRRDGESGNILIPPKPQLLDPLTRIDELLVALVNLQAAQAAESARVQAQIAEALRVIGAPATALAPLTPHLAEAAGVRDAAVGGTDVRYLARTYSLTSARTDEKVRLEGDFIHAWTDGDLDGVGVRFNNAQNDIVYFKRRNPVTVRFWEFYLTHAAQSGKTLDIFIGRQASATALTADVTVTSTQRFHTVSTDKDTHFTGALAQYAKEDENVTGLASNNIRITNIAIQSDQNLHFWLVFWATDGFDNTDLDTDTFKGAVELDLSVWGLQPGGANQYYMSLEDVNLDYTDSDGTRELHTSLYNEDATSKNAGATGEVKVDFTYEVRAA